MSGREPLNHSSENELRRRSWSEKPAERKIMLQRGTPIQNARICAPGREASFFPAGRALPSLESHVPELYTMHNQNTFVAPLFANLTKYEVTEVINTVHFLNAVFPEGIGELVVG